MGHHHVIMDPHPRPTQYTPIRGGKTVRYHQAAEQGRSVTHRGNPSSLFVAATLPMLPNAAAQLTGNFSIKFSAGNMATLILRLVQ